MKRGDFVIWRDVTGDEDLNEDYRPSLLGLVRRVARDGSWADVWWRTKDESWAKRMNVENLEVWEDQQ